MATSKSKPTAKKASPMQRARATLRGEARAAYGDIERGLKNLEKSVSEIQRGLVKAEKRIEADARERVRELRQEAKTQLKVLQGKQREAAGLLKNLGAAAGDSWKDVKRAGDSLLSEASTAAASVIERFRNALGK